MSNYSSALTYSVITVCLNTQDTIQRTIDSVRYQVYPNIEYIVIDGGSEDETINIVQRNINNISFFLSEPDRGIYHAMNKGVLHSHGDVLFFLNADDYFADENVLTDAAAVFKKNPTVDLVYGNQIFDHGDRLSHKRQHFQITRKQLACMTIQHQTIFAKKSLLEKTNGFSLNFKIVSDYDWLLRVLFEIECNHLYIDRNISCMSTSGVSWTSNFEKERLIVMKRYFSDVEIFKWRVLPNIVKKLNKAGIYARKWISNHLRLVFLSLRTIKKHF